MTTASQTGEDRRNHRRFRIHLAVVIDAGATAARVGVSQDASVDGLLFNTRSRFLAGDVLTLTLHLASTDAEETRVRAVRAKVVRVESVELNSSLPWRYLTAVRFEHPVPEIEEILASRDRETSGTAAASS